MKIEFLRTGGFAGPASRKQIALDASTLSPEDQQQLNDLVTAAKRPQPPRPESASPSQRRDAFDYRISVNSADQQLVFNGPMEDIPAAARPLVTWLENLASRTPAPKK